ncbi:MAG: adenylyltransferase/cytidyltransferase family protein [Oscillospiraceae bacterium]|nr:adenylyltransferase/cytidyltransferase family protein [Oscillospiraceae bacterium]
MKQYKIGMYGGKFLPFHKGHKYCIDFAAQECEKVYVILFRGGAEEEKIRVSHQEEWLSAEERIRKMKELCRQACQYAEVIPVSIDITTLRLPDGSEDWDAETPLVRSVLGNCLDAVYSSEESYGSYFSRAYPEAVHRLVDVQRLHYPISGTRIREMTSMEEKKKWII